MRPGRFGGFGGGRGRSGIVVTPPPAEDPIPVTQSTRVDIEATRVLPIDVTQSIAVAVAVQDATYSPLSEGNLLLWIDYQDAASYTVVGGNITAVTNKVSGVAIAPTDGTLPYEATGLNGHPCAHPNATGDACIGTEAAVVALGDTTSASKPYTWFTVWQGDVLDIASYIFGWGNSAQVTSHVRGFGQSGASTGRMGGQHIVNPSTSVVSSTAASDITTAHVHCWHGDSTHNFHIDGGAAAPATAVQSVVGITPNRFALYCQPRQTPTGVGQGRNGEQLLFAAELDSAAIARVTAYLKAKWGTP